MARILLINPNSRNSGLCYTVLPPLGLLYVGTVLDGGGHALRILDADAHDLNSHQVLSFASDFEPDVVGLSLNCAQLHGGYELIEAIKRDFPRTWVIAGGPHPSALKEEVFRECASLDAAVVGEGERTALELVETLADGGDLGNVPGVIYRRGNSITSNPSRDFIENLDAIPLPNYDLLEGAPRYPGTFPIAGHPQVHLMAVRGCPFHCSFCNDSVWGNTVRMRSPASVVDEIELLYERFRAREVFFQDDTLNVSKPHFHEICDEIIARGLQKKLIFKASMRANESSVDAPLLEKAREAGFWLLFYGVETGNAEMMQSLNKKLTLLEVSRAFELTRKAGIKTLASFMIGNLGESRETAEDTFRFFTKLDPDFAGLSIAIPFPGTQFYREAQQRGLLRIQSFRDFRFGQAVTDTGFLPAEEVWRLHKAYQKRMTEYKRSESRKKKILKRAGNGFSREEAVWHAEKDYFQFTKGLLNFHPNHIPIRFLDYEKSFEPKYNIYLYGWHQPEIINDDYVCWNNGSSQVVLRYDPHFSFVNVTLFVAHPNIIEDPVKVKVEVMGLTQVEFKISENKWCDLQIPFSLPVQSDRITVMLSVDRTFNPKALGINEDCRNLGLMVKRVWLS